MWLRRVVRSREQIEIGLVDLDEALGRFDAEVSERHDAVVEISPTVRRRRQLRAFLCLSDASQLGEHRSPLAGALSCIQRFVRGSAQRLRIVVPVAGSHGLDADRGARLGR